MSAEQSTGESDWIACFTDELVKVYGQETMRAQAHAIAEREHAHRSNREPQNAAREWFRSRLQSMLSMTSQEEGFDDTSAALHRPK